MIELKNDSLTFSFPEVHAEAQMSIDFQRTLRIPDDGKTYPLPPGLGRFPLRHVDDHSKNVPAQWLDHGGVMLPMYQSEALWLYFASPYIFNRESSYPFAVKVATGKIDAVTGKGWSDSLHPKPQDYLVVPGQPWLDGYCVKKGSIRQFVAMPLGAGYSAEEQITGKAEHGGLQIVVFPMKAEAFERRFPVREEMFLCRKLRSAAPMTECALGLAPSMGLAPGGLMRQEIYEDAFDFDDWDLAHSSRCFVHIANSLVWRSITGQEPPTTPPTAREYSKAGFPWFDYYADAKAVEGSSILNKLASVFTLGKKKGDVPLPENDSAEPERVVKLRSGLRKDQVREGSF
jgi:hypothetical protein